MFRLLCILGILALSLGLAVGCGGTEETPEENIPSGNMKIVAPDGSEVPQGQTSAEELEKRAKAAEGQ